MDREISLKERRKTKLKRIWPVVAAVVAVCAVAVWLVCSLSGGIDERDLNLGVAEIGEINSAVTTNGKIIPAFEEIIVSPVNTRILEVYVHEGDSVEKGTLLLRLDLEEADNQYRRMSDELSIKRSELKSQSLTSETQLTDLEMRIKTKELDVDQLKAEY